MKIEIKTRSRLGGECRIETLADDVRRGRCMTHKKEVSRVDRCPKNENDHWTDEWDRNVSAPVKVEKGDRVKITMPAQEPFQAGWCEGVVLKVDDMGKGRGGLYVELEKDRVSTGWDTGYGYWKQEVDGGTIEVLKKGK